MATDPESSFDKAIDVFRSKSGLSNREIMDMKMTTLADLQKTLAAVQQRQQNSKTMKFLRRLQPFLDSMEQYSKAVNIFANASDIVAFIWVCCPMQKCRLQSCSMLSGANEIHSHCE